MPKTKTTKSGRRIVKSTHPLNVLVNRELFEQANKVRTQTWVEIVELALRAVITAGAGKKAKAS